jgi:hypothetical protein
MSPGKPISPANRKRYSGKKSRFFDNIQYWYPHDSTDPLLIAIFGRLKHKGSYVGGAL